MNEEPPHQSMTEPADSSRGPDDITEEKRQRREEVIAKIQTLLDESFKRSMENPKKRGIKSKQKWFSISASLAQSLARLISDLEFEKIRHEVDAAKKRMVDHLVTRPRGPFIQIDNKLDRQESSDH